MRSTPVSPMTRMFREAQHELRHGFPPQSSERVRFIQSRAFTQSAEWARLRYDFLRDHDGRCRCCGRGSADRVKVNVDHIRPRRTHPQLALCYGNLQVLCGPCNRGKGNRDQTDWRYRVSASTVSVARTPASAPFCVQCQAPMCRRQGARGPFWGCTRYPECLATRPDGTTPAVPRRRPRSGYIRTLRGWKRLRRRPKKILPLSRPGFPPTDLLIPSLDDLATGALGKSARTADAREGKSASLRHGLSNALDRAPFGETASELTMPR